MAGVVLETVSNKQLVIFTFVLLGIQILFFIIGGTIGNCSSFRLTLYIVYICCSFVSLRRDKIKPRLLAKVWNPISTRNY